MRNGDCTTTNQCANNKLTTGSTIVEKGNGKMSQEKRGDAMPKQKRSSQSFKPRYRLEISQRQAELISNAVELYARLGTGQFGMLEYFFWGNLEELEKARPHFDQLQLIKNGSLHSYSGIHMKKDRRCVSHSLRRLSSYSLQASYGSSIQTTKPFERRF
jgi:hypothetical protein